VHCLQVSSLMERHLTQHEGRCCTHTPHFKTTAHRVVVPATVIDISPCLHTVHWLGQKSVGNANFVISDTFVGTSGPWGNMPDSHMESDRRRGQKMGIVKAGGTVESAGRSHASQANARTRERGIARGEAGRSRGRARRRTVVRGNLGSDRPRTVLRQVEVGLPSGKRTVPRDVTCTRSRRGLCWEVAPGS